MVTFDFYLTIYKGNKVTSVETFEQLAVRAEPLIKRYESTYTISYYDGYCREWAACAVIDELYATQQAQSGTEADKGAAGNVKSISIGNVSTSFDTVPVTDIVNSESIRILNAVRLYAHVFRGVRKC